MSRVAKRPLAFAAACLALVAMHPGQAGSNEPPPDALVGELPFMEFPEPNRIVLDLAREGRKRRIQVIVDTGASHSVATPLAARALGVNVRSSKSDPYRRSTSLGHPLLFWVDTRFSDTGSRTGWEYALVGGNFLEQFVVEFDFPARRARFYDPDRYRIPPEDPAPDAVSLEIEVTNRRPFVTAVVNGAPIQMLLDTGAPPGVVISGESARAAGVETSGWASLSTGGMLGPIQARVGPVDSFELGGFELGALPTLVAPRGTYNQGGNTDSLIGYDLLAQFVVRIDYPRQRLWLRRVERGPVPLYGVPFEDLESWQRAVAAEAAEANSAAEPDEAEAPAP